MASDTTSYNKSKHRPEAVFRVRGNKIFWGPGLQELLIRVDKCGSIKKAAAEMYMSYAKARRLIALAEEELGFQILESQKGGVSGGSSILTEKGRRYLDICCKVQEEVQRYCDERFVFHCQPFDL